MVAAVLAIATETKNQYQHRSANFNAAANQLDNSGVQDIFTIDVAGLVRIGVHLTVATAALSAFQIQGLFHPDGAYVTLKSLAAHYTSPSGILVDSSGDLTTLAVGSGWFILDVAGLNKIKLRANSSAASSTLAMVGSGV